MNYKDLLKIVEKQIKVIIADCLEAIDSKYSICMISSDPVVTKMIILLMKENNVVLEESEYPLLNRNCIIKSANDLLGNGHIHFPIPKAHHLIESIDQAVYEVLETFNLKIFNGFFAEIVNKKLEKVLIEKDLGSFIDAIVNYAFFAGVQGDEDKGLKWLNDFLTHKEKGERSTKAPFLLEDAIEYLVSAGVVSPHDFKVILGYFVVNRLKMNYTKASKLLRISRTTLHDYVRRASSIGLDDAFFQKELQSLKNKY